MLGEDMGIVPAADRNYTKKPSGHTPKRAWSGDYHPSSRLLPEESAQIKGTKGSTRLILKEGRRGRTALSLKLSAVRPGDY